jgi:cell division protease FtsH
MSVSRQQNISEVTAQTIDKEVRRLIEEGHQEATRILTEKREQLEALARGLLEYETLTGDEIKNLLDGNPPVRETEPEPAQGRSSAIPRRPRPKGEGGLEPQPQA